jgi:hypothetical protein
MHPPDPTYVARLLGARAVHRLGRIQPLWRGWGEIARYAVEGGPTERIVVKVVDPPPLDAKSVGSRRKARSYEVEAAFYRDVAGRISDRVRIPHVWHVSYGLFLLEDLDAAGFSGRAVGAGSLPADRLGRSVDWLADLHRAGLDLHLDPGSLGLWPTGTYWHLVTRPDELAAMPPGPLKDAAAAIDAELRRCPIQTLVHGDAKVANLCYAPESVAAVDFQYTGGGPGIVDLVYFLGSVLDDQGLAAEADDWTTRYFERLNHRAAEAAWRPLVPFAWADFERFLAGWSPGHWKRSGYAAEQTRRALQRL